LAIRGASAGDADLGRPVLGGALAAGHRHRVYDAVISRRWGNARAAARRLRAEYLMIGFCHRDLRRDRGLGCGLADCQPG